MYFPEACPSVAKGGQFKVGEILTSCNTSHHDFTNFVVTPLQGVLDIIEWILSFQISVILLVHIVFYVSTLILIEMMKRESLQDDFPNDCELEPLLITAYTLYHEINK